MEGQVTGREIILDIAVNMHQGLEPLLYTTLAPNIYDVYLHIDDYERLQGLFDKIAEDAKKALDEEIDRLNGETWPQKILRSLPGLGKKAEHAYVRAGDGWFINFYKNTEEDAETGEIVIESHFALPSTSRQGIGSMTKRIVTLRSGEQTRMLRKSYERTEEDASISDSSTTEPARALARISYEDHRGSQVYSMTKNQIVIGRGGTGYWVDLRLHAPSDISREHIRLRRDESKGQFFIKDLSTFGTTVDGESIPKSVEIVNGERQDKDVWAPLPSKARIGLADTIFLDFEAL